MMLEGPPVRAGASWPGWRLTHGPRGPAARRSRQRRFRLQLLVIKMFLAAVAVAAGLVASLSMLAVLGRPTPPANAGRLRAVHRVSGYVFAGSLVALASVGWVILASAGDGLSVRGVLHWVIGSLLVIVAAVKILMVRYYKKFLKAAPGLGVLTLVLVLLAATLSAGFVIAVRVPPWAVVVPEREVVNGVPERAAEASGETPDAEAGRALFLRNCAGCHGPGASGTRQLAGLFEMERLASSGRPVTRENVSAQLLDPVGAMPSFRGRLSEAEISALLDYLETL